MLFLSCLHCNTAFISSVVLKFEKVFGNVQEEIQDCPFIVGLRSNRERIFESIGFF